MHQGLIKAPDRMGTGLARFLSTHKTSKRKVISSVTGHRAVSRLLSLPPLKDHLLDDAVRREARKEMLLPLEENYLSWQVIQRENKHVQVYVLAIPKLVIDRQIEALGAAKIKLGMMDIKPLALVRAVNRSSAIIVNLEEQSLGVMIVHGGLPVMIRSMPQNGMDSGSEAALDRLSVELTRTTQFYNESHQDQPLESNVGVFLTGKPFDDEEIRKQFAAKISFPTRIPNPPVEFPDKFPVATYIGNIGLALKRR
jgi:Tfp pilus assembly PilM family ATPase